MATVERAMALLQVLERSPRDLGTNEVARLAGLNVSTASRLLATLDRKGWVSRSAETGRFRLGPRLVELGNAALARIDVRDRCRVHLVSMAELTGETATLSVPYADGPITVDFVQSPSSVRSVAEVGRHAVAHATATGKVWLAFTGRTPDDLTSYTRRTITDRAALAAEVEHVRQRGWAQSVGEREDDLNAIAAPVLAANGALTAILGLQGPAHRFGPRAMRVAADQLTRHARAASALPMGQ
ncbi:MAG: IclR family transcriptional regulator [Nocardioides sp.]